MKQQKAARQKFKWKFTKGMFQRPLETSSFLVLLKEQERNWRGTLLAVISIGLISGLIILTALFVTSSEERISYERFTIEELMWLGDRARDLNYFWHENQFIYSHPDSTWKIVDVGGRELLTFDDAAAVTKTVEMDLSGLTPIISISPNSQKTAWLVQFSENKQTLQDVTYLYAIVFPFSDRRIPVDPSGTGNGSAFLHFVEWGQSDFSLFAHQGANLYYSEDIRLPKTGSGFRCLTCNLEPGWTFGYPGWIYRKYFQYRPGGAVWEHKDSTTSKILLLATDERHLRSLLLPHYLIQDQNGVNTVTDKAVYVPFQTQPEVPRVPLVDIVLMDHGGNLLANISWVKMNTLMERVLPETAYISENNRGLYITRVQWFNATGFLVTGLSETQKCGFITFCQWSSGSTNVECQYVWYQCVELGWLNMHRLFVGGNLFFKYGRENEVLTILPYVAPSTGFTYQLAVLRVIPNQKNRVTWLTEYPFQVDQLVHSDDESIHVTGSFQPGIRHLYRLDRRNTGSLFCLTCNELSELMTDVILAYPTNASRNITIESVTASSSISIGNTKKQTAYRSVQTVRTSTNGRCFTVQWSTGYETFGASGVKEAPTKWMINQLTGAGFNANETGQPMLEPKVRFDPDSGVSLWCRSRRYDKHVYLVWHSHYVIDPALKGNWTADQYLSNVPTAFRRNLRLLDTLSHDTQNTKSAKQHQLPTNTYHTKVRFKLLNATQLPLHMLYPEPPFGDRPMPNVIMRHINLRQTDILVENADKSTTALIEEDEPIKDGAVVRFWFPPYLNEGNQQHYPLLVNVISKLAPASSQLDRLSEELTVFMSASLDTVVMRVEHWTGEAENRLNQAGIDGELQNYQALFDVLNRTLRYHYLEKNKTALYGSQGMNAHLAGLLLRTDRIPMNPACGALIAPIVSWKYHDFTEAVRVFPAPDEFSYLEFDLTKFTKYSRQKEILLVHGTADTVVPFAQTARLAKVLAEQKVDFSLLPLFDTDHSYENTSIHKSILTKLIVFLHDCLRRTEDERRKMYTDINFIV
ncbi:hypothetical protein CRM22_003651 [Opisthorchis felineus]|uniref:Peptidase S9 prolyl oligopeptidase catalytic domain-containing protein n=1 Tax=Opisthorchis felineus TaxID=147828 RepID=A0A4S2M0U9_OPIFE|nr:hypothetical protein CRM22_003651 [Opisthorchis felineus]